MNTPECSRRRTRSIDGRVSNEPLPSSASEAMKLLHLSILLFRKQGMISITPFSLRDGTMIAHGLSGWAVVRVRV